MDKEVQFIDILSPKNECRIFHMMTRAIDPKKSYVLDRYYSPQDLKELVAKSVYLDAVVEAESSRTGVSKQRLHREVLGYLEEMGLDRKVHVIRWMGVIFLKISVMMKIGVFVNEPAVHKVKQMMGSNPVLFLPTHRSYADFCLMTYLCYHYDIEFPAVAAGMDFYSMAVIGRLMRETCAYYIRRTLVGAPLYAATLRQYVRTLVANHNAPIEFFLEGTRSRSNKSLSPKYGMLSMSLVAYFAREVPDVTLVPVNISYDRLMEQALFAYEHLGVPKPKESTGGFFKALRGLNDHFGNIYINIGAPLSVREYLRSDPAITDETLKPLDLQQLSPAQFGQVQDIANYVVTLQQRSAVATISNLLALVLMSSVVTNEPLAFEKVLEEVEWAIQVLRSLGASVFENDVKSSVVRILVVHSKMMRLDKEGRLRLVSGDLIHVSDDVKKKMKGHTLAAETMVNAVPIIQLQLYVNPMLHYLVPPAIISLIVQRGPTTYDDLVADYQRIRKLLRYEFFHIEKEEENTFKTALNYCIENTVIVPTSTGSYVTGGGEDNKLRNLLKWSVHPALTTLLKCAEVMAEQRRCEHKQALKLIQQRIESERCHPYCLSLEAADNCLRGLALCAALRRHASPPNIITYEADPETLESCKRLVSSVLPTCAVDYGRTNPVILDHRNVASRL